VRVIQLAERRSTDLAAARPYPVAAGNLAPLSIRRIPCASSRPEPAIDDEAGSVHVAGIVRGQEQNALGDTIGTARRPHGTVSVTVSRTGVVSLLPVRWARATKVCSPMSVWMQGVGPAAMQQWLSGVTSTIPRPAEAV
jgi:hypothetical protein